MSVGHRISCYFGAILPIIGLFWSGMSRYAISRQKHLKQEPQNVRLYSSTTQQRQKQTHGQVVCYYSCHNADGHWHSSEPLRHRCCQCFGDMALQRSNFECQKISYVFARIGFALIRPQMERHLMHPGMCLGKTFRGGNLFGELSGSTVWGNCQGWEIPREKKSREKCWDPHAGLQVCTCSGYDLCHPGYIHSLQSYTLTDRYRQLLTGYTISSASGANKNSEHAMLITSFIMHDFDAI